MFPLTAGLQPRGAFTHGSVFGLYVVQHFAGKRVALDELARCDAQLADFCRNIDLLAAPKKFLALHTGSKKAIAFNSEKDLPFSPFDEGVYVAPIGKLAMELLQHVFPPRNARFEFEDAPGRLVHTQKRTPSEIQQLRAAAIVANGWEGVPMHDPIRTWL